VFASDKHPIREKIALTKRPAFSSSLRSRGKTGRTK
jgi:hypothetical protein